jgi:NAD-dependent dihydropyrimidine dehydrogenase PreA subunit
VGPLQAAELRVQPPEFESDYQLPGLTAPAPRAAVCDVLDVGVLVATLALASYFSLRLRSRRAIFALMVFSLLYFGLWRGGCICPIGAIQNVCLGLSGAGYAVPLVVLAVFVLPLMFALFFGRAFCGGVCPLGAIQDLVALRPLKVPAWLGGALGLLAYVYLGLAVLFSVISGAYFICRYDPFVSIFRLAPVGKWAQAISQQQVPGGAFGIAGKAELLVLGGAMLVIGVFVARPYCRFLCPLGALLRVCSALGRKRVIVTPEECVKCRLCEDSCPFGAIRKPTGEPAAADYGLDKRRLGWLLALLPVLIGASALLGWLAGPHLARMDYTVRLAERIRMEDAGQVEGQIPMSEAFRGTGRPKADLRADALRLSGSYALGGTILGGFVGLVVGAKLIALSVRRRRTDYEADPATCLSCGRCFQYCPIEKRRRKAAKEAAAAVGV